MKKKQVRLARISQKKVREALEQQIIVARSHLDLDGFCYVKLVRTGPDDCFAQDVTSGLLRGEHELPKMTYREMERELWRHPAMERFGTPM